jgi:hypothetical protein
MHVRVAARVGPAKCGAAAYADAIPLAGHGADERAAMDSLRRSVEAWCEGLLAAQSLEVALTRRNLNWTTEGDLVTVDLVRIA